jgi:pyruvate dehydrogenase E2 component (dihydrolipoamide acetyltransferase)
MAAEIRLGKLSPTMETGTINRWLKNEGDTVSSGDTIAEVETDKASMPLEVFEDGTLLKIVAPTGATVKIDDLVAVIGQPGEDISGLLPGAPHPTLSPGGRGQGEGAAVPRAKTGTSILEPDEGPAPPAGEAGERVKASPLAKKLAQERGIDLRTLRPTGPGGRIIQRDVPAEPAPTPLTPPSPQGGEGRARGAAVPAAGGGLDIPLSNLRQTIARRLSLSKQSIPHWYLFCEVLMDRAMQFREELNASIGESGTKISVTDLIIKVVAVALARHPEMNSSFSEGKIHRHGAISIAIAVATEDGLYTPVLRNADHLGLEAISAAVKELTRKTREKKLKAEDLGGSSFTISNLGMFGVDHFFAIINPPEAAILAIGAVKPKPVINSAGQFVAGKAMSLTLSCDHRVIDGVVGAKFMGTIKELLEQPAKLLL